MYKKMIGSVPDWRGSFLLFFYFICYYNDPFVNMHTYAVMYTYIMAINSTDILKYVKAYTV